MALIEKQDYVLYETAITKLPDHPTKMFYTSVLSTKNYVFILPKRSFETYIFLEIKRTFEIFPDSDTYEGLKKIVAAATSVDQLEQTMIELLNNEKNLVIHIPEKKSFQFKGFLGKQTLIIKHQDKGFISLLVQGGKSKLFRAFHGQ